MKKQEYSPPAEHGSKLLDPPHDQLHQLWQNNLHLRAQVAVTRIGQADLASLQAQARAELLHAAAQYSSQYLDRSVELSAPDQPIIMAGHQPELFHPGVWFKNFALANLSRQFSAIPVNLIVDNDLCTHRSIGVPVGIEGPQRIESLSLDQPVANSPFEGAFVNDQELFRSAGRRIETAVQRLIASPIITELWPEVLRAGQRLTVDGLTNFGQALAAGRHRLEARYGLPTLEVPVSRLSRTASFANFVWQILNDSQRFASLHNQGLEEYRTLYRLRSKTHPFPDLEQRDDWIETPFWVFHDASSRRNSLFVRQRTSTLELTDLEGWSLSLAAGAEQLLEQIVDERLPIRPRALTTTLFSRMFLSDLFIHGTGGGKYDQFTDWLAAQLWQVRLPDFCVASATYKLFPEYPTVTPETIQLQKQQLRELEMNPDRFLKQVADPSEVPQDIRSAAELKQAWIRGEQIGSGKERQAAISECNRVIKQFTEPLKIRLLANLAEHQRRLEREQSFGSREFSFCLHPIERISQLLQC